MEIDMVGRGEEEAMNGNGGEEERELSSEET